MSLSDLIPKNRCQLAGCENKQYLLYTICFKHWLLSEEKRVEAPAPREEK